MWCNRPFQTAPSQDPNEIGVAGLDTVEVAGVRVDSDKADMNVEEGERRTLQLKDLAPEKKTKTLLCLFQWNSWMIARNKEVHSFGTVQRLHC